MIAELARLVELAKTFQTEPAIARRSATFTLSLPELFTRRHRALLHRLRAPMAKVSFPAFI
jgi:hypothetical protein